MAIVRKRTRLARDGTAKVTWLVDYRDAAGERRFETFRLKKQADARLTDIEAGLKLGTHSPLSTSKTIREAGEFWFQRCKTLNRERATLTNYRRFLDQHILPLLGRLKLSQLTTPGVEDFCDALQKRVPPLTARDVLTALKGILREAKRRGLVSQNVAIDSRIEISNRDHQPLEIGRTIPTKEEVRLMIDSAKGRWRPFVVVLAFCGLRSSELRGLRWEHVDLDRRTIRVEERADRYNTLGSPKSKAGNRTVPLSPMTINILKEWRLRCPKSKANLVFPSAAGTPLLLSNVTSVWWRPMQKQAGIVDKAGNPKYKMHALRHFCASHWIELEFAPKKVQEMLGHSSIVMTFDRYGHLFPSHEADQEKLSKGDLFLTGA